MDEIYSSVQSHTTAQIKIDGSRFIADVLPVLTEDDAKEKLEIVRKKYFDATHHCYAYVIGVEKKIIRYSDDGEPSGTAGVKIYSALQSKNLSDVLLVVTRYFGGTKLGVGGLGRAYFKSAESGINSATIISKALVQEMQIAFPFSETNSVMNIINSHKLKISATKYFDKHSIITLQILPCHISSIRELFVNATRGSSEILIRGKKTVNWQ
jgi:uncharacterized YigZ family protein